MAEASFYIIIVFIIVEFILERYLGYLNNLRRSYDLPKELAGIYDEERYRRSQEYLKVNTQFGVITSTFSLVLILLVLFVDGFAWLDEWVRTVTGSQVLQALLFFGVIGFLADILSIPFSIYSTFVIEERFGFNKTTVKTFILDKIKGWAVGALIGGVLLSLVVWSYTIFGEWFWIVAWAIVAIFSLVMTMFYSEIIVPLFNKQTPLEEGELREAIEDFSARVGFRLDDVYVIDSSKRSTKANAYFSGLSKKKRIVLYDTLISEHPKEEIVAVLAHEIGHFRKKHTLTGTLMSLARTGLLLFLLSIFIDSPVLAQALGADQPSFHIGILAFGLLYSPISTLLDLLSNYISRRHEYQADEFAGLNYDPESLKEALKKLSVSTLSNLRPHPAYVFVHYSHPPVLKRLEHLDEIAKRRST